MIKVKSICLSSAISIFMFNTLCSITELCVAVWPSASRTPCASCSLRPGVAMEKSWVPRAGVPSSRPCCSAIELTVPGNMLVTTSRMSTPTSGSSVTR